MVTMMFDLTQMFLILISQALAGGAPWLLHHLLMAWSRMENASLGKGGAVEPGMLTAIARKAGSQLSEFMKDWEVTNVSSSP